MKMNGFDKDDEFRFEQLVKARDNNNTVFYFWMSFFTVAIGALFVGYYTMISSEGYKACDYKAETTLILSFGYFVSLIWHWSCKGYYYWVNNWISLILNHEKELCPTRSIYSCFYDLEDKRDLCSYWKPLRPANISTGRLLGLFSFGTAVAWGILLLKWLPVKLLSELEPLSVLGFSIFGTGIISWIFSEFFKHSKMNIRTYMIPNHAFKKTNIAVLIRIGFVHGLYTLC